jgi:hypothetical protein
MIIIIIVFLKEITHDLLFVLQHWIHVHVQHCIVGCGATAQNRHDIDDEYKHRDAGQDQEPFSAPRGLGGWCIELATPTGEYFAGCSLLVFVVVTVGGAQWGLAGQERSSAVACERDSTIKN